MYVIYVPGQRQTNGMNLQCIVVMCALLFKQDYRKSFYCKIRSKTNVFSKLFHLHSDLHVTKNKTKIKNEFTYFVTSINRKAIRSNYRASLVLKTGRFKISYF